MIRLVEALAFLAVTSSPQAAAPKATAPAVVAQAQASAQAQPKSPAPAPAAKAPAPAPAPVKPGTPAAAPSATDAKAPAGPQLAPEDRALVDRMQKFYEDTQDFTANFQQVYAYKTFKRKQTSSGTVTFKKPGLMRWEYLKPSPRTFVLAGDRVYMHDPEARMLTKAAIDTSQLSASVTFLFGKGRLQDEFQISKVACGTCKGVLFDLTPKKPDPRFQKVKLEVDPKSAQVVTSTVIDPDGSENTIAFSNLKTNVGVAADAFKLTPPAGTQVVDYTQQGQQAPAKP